MHESSFLPLRPSPWREPSPHLGSPRPRSSSSSSRWRGGGAAELGAWGDERGRGGGGRVRRRRRRGGAVGAAERQRLHQLRRATEGLRALLHAGGLLLQLPPRRSGQPLLPRMLRHHALPRLSLLFPTSPPEMAGYMSRGLLNGTVYVCNLPPGADETMLAEYFGTIGLLKKDKRTGRPKIWLYRDKVTNEPKGDATITYEDPHAASAAVEWFNNKDFHGSTIQVHIAESKSKDTFDHSVNMSMAADLGGQDDLDNGAGGGRGHSDGPGKGWQQDGDWLCPNTSCGNVNFAFRGVCNRCGAARPAGASGTGAGGGGEGRGRGSTDTRGTNHTVGGPPGLFGPNDWPCPMCGNINWAKRFKCNICNTTKPGHNEGGVRGGRGGGYKELDEEELEETKRRRKEAEEDDGEMYDEFGNLKKKFRAKAQQTEIHSLSGSGDAGWDDEQCGSSERDDREGSRDKGRDYDERESRNRDRDGHRRERHRSRSRDRERGRDRRRDHGHEKNDRYR